MISHFSDFARLIRKLFRKNQWIFPLNYLTTCTNKKNHLMIFLMTTSCWADETFLRPLRQIEKEIENSRKLYVILYFVIS